MAMNLLILGVAGFLGAHFTRFIVNHAKRSWHVTLNLYPLRIIPPELIELSSSSPARVEIKTTWADVEDYYALREVTVDKNFCLNFSRLSWSLKAHRKAGIEYENMVDTVFQACLANGVQKTIHVTCALLFGPTRKNARSESHIPRTLRSKPRSVPRFVKALEREFYHLQKYVTDRIFPVSVIYFPPLVGLGETHIIGDLMLDYLLNNNSILEKLVLEKNKGHHRLNMLPVSEAVNACQQVLLDPRIGIQYLVAGRDVTLQDLLAAWKDSDIPKLQVKHQQFCQQLANHEHHWLNKFMTNRRFKSRQGNLAFKQNKELMKLLSHDWSFASINYVVEDEHALTTEKVLDYTVKTLQAYQEELLKVVDSENG